MSSQLYHRILASEVESHGNALLQTSQDFGSDGTAGAEADLEDSDGLAYRPPRTTKKRWHWCRCDKRHHRVGTDLFPIEEGRARTGG